MDMQLTAGCCGRCKTVRVVVSGEPTVVRISRLRSLLALEFADVQAANAGFRPCFFSKLKKYPVQSAKSQTVVSTSPN